MSGTTPIKPKMINLTKPRHVSPPKDSFGSRSRMMSSVDLEYDCLDPTPYNLIFGSAAFKDGNCLIYGNRICNYTHKERYTFHRDFRPRAMNKTTLTDPEKLEYFKRYPTKLVLRPENHVSLPKESAPTSHPSSPDQDEKPDQDEEAHTKQEEPISMKFWDDGLPYTLILYPEIIPIAKEHGIFYVAEILCQEDERIRKETEWCLTSSEFPENKPDLSLNCINCDRKCHPEPGYMPTKFISQDYNIAHSPNCLCLYFTSRRGLNHNDRPYYYCHGQLGVETRRNYEKWFRWNLVYRNSRHHLSRRIRNYLYDWRLSVEASEAS